MANLNMTELLADKGFQNALAGFGVGLDPEGVGGALGKAAIGWNKSKAAQESVDAANKADKDFKSQLIALMSGGTTPKDMAGLTSIGITGDEVTMKGTLPREEDAGIKPNNQPISSRLKDISPFFSALIGE
jgi:hypothetical protein